MNKKGKILNSLVPLLISFNIAAFLLSLAFTVRKTNYSYNTGDPFSYFINTRYFPAVPWVSLAALVLSIGIYYSVKGYLDAHSEE